MWGHGWRLGWVGRAKDGAEVRADYGERGGRTAPAKIEQINAAPAAIQNWPATGRPLKTPVGPRARFARFNLRHEGAPLIGRQN